MIYAKRIKINQFRFGFGTSLICSSKIVIHADNDTVEKRGLYCSLGKVKKHPRRSQHEGENEKISWNNSPSLFRFDDLSHLLVVL